MEQKINNKTTLKQLTKIIEYINDLGYDCYIEGVGNGEIKLVIIERSVTLI